MLRIAALACLLLAVLAPLAAAAGRAGTARALSAQMRWAGPSSGALAVEQACGGRGTGRLRGGREESGEQRREAQDPSHRRVQTHTDG